MGLTDRARDTGQWAPERRAPKMGKGTEQMWMDDSKDSGSQRTGWRAWAERCHGESHTWLMANPGLDPGNELELLKKPFPVPISECASWNGVWLSYEVTQLPNPWETKAEPQGQAHMPLSHIARHAGLNHGPGRLGRPQTSGKGWEHSVLLPSRILCSPVNSHHSKESSMEIPGIFSGRGSEGTSGSSICSCKKQRVRP